MEFRLPTDQSIASSHLWHGDLHAANIFVNPSKHTEIVGLIDWQSSELSPLYFHARQPHIIDYNGSPHAILLIDGETSYLSKVLELGAIWDTLPGAKTSVYPFLFSSKERQIMEANVECVMRGMEAMESIKESIGELFPEQGIVRPDQYEEALDALEQMKDQVIEEFARSEEEKEIWLKEWPFGT
ncbi:hypothetical protein sscle_08g064080 [Sclerotinia sclerotiorum 1980 UF-70]|uniref:Altered inheritance of mitochondria protein 9, mitochondrial n=2 Tax=Sclerotinia sclerotiorum (strain ATCC 18683 / 1980 / Ss-1) TaxID=665079 RepID=A0A1D9Q9R3_SCLS1|nr:hypothetical protein sscle_08g064080 [Sclerotinia sclerotiorum 1980 UF-70]